MNDEQLKKILFRMGETKVKLPEHRTALRAALLRQHAQARQPYFVFSTVTKFVTMKAAWIPVSTFAVLALVFVGTVGISHKSAEAQELVQRSMARAVKLAPEMRAQIEAQLKADMMQTLKDAYAAPDLRILTKEEYEKEAQFTIATGTVAFGVSKKGAPGVEDSDVMISGNHELGEAPIAIAYRVAAHAAAGEDVMFERHVDTAAGAQFSAGTVVGSMASSVPVKYLRYTDPDGRKVTLGLDDTDTPVFRIEELISSDVVPGPDGTIGIQGRVMKMINVQGATLDQKTEN